MESLAFAVAMCDSTISNSEKIEKMKAAIVAHKALANMANAGEGILTHLIGLNLIANENNITTPSIFLDEGYAKGTHYKIITSQVKYYSIHS